MVPVMPAARTPIDAKRTSAAAGAAPIPYGVTFG